VFAETAGRFASEALSLGKGEVCALFRRSFYLRFPGERYACVGDPSLGRGPLNALVAGVAMPALGDMIAVSVEQAALWTPSPITAGGRPELSWLQNAAIGRVPEDGLGCLIIGTHNSVANHAQPALDALGAWLAGNRLAEEAGILIGLGPGLTPSGDDYLGGILVALRACGRGPQADALWRWLKPRLAERTSAISAAHLAAAAAGEAHEALHECLQKLLASEPANDPGWDEALERLDCVGHSSGWDGLAGALAVARVA
jgi:hypothetical protein